MNFINLKTFMNSPDELHAFVIGFCEVLCPWPPRLGMLKKKADCHCERSEAISKEYHYYLFGRGMAVIAWLIIAKIIQEAFW